jgi:hypothetical protein
MRRRPFIISRIITRALIATAPNGAYQCTFNPLDEYKNEVQENKRLYEALLKTELEKIALIERLLSDKK